MCAEGVLLADSETPDRVQTTPGRRTPPPTTEELDYHRYALTDLLDDLRGCPDPLERVYLVTHLLQRAAELALLTDGHWLGGGKWLSRRLAAADPDLHTHLTEAASAALSTPTAEPALFTAAVEEILDRTGGPLWTGYSRR
ncbi:nucleotidyltransferase domain-containing protein [Streptomyces violaceus]|uniref:Nucleotidyltransferase domain-containing protein n=1 Tax=Streptomyces violaceus TaxID=1936 RepID=A0ABY9UK78_STRVL|nr:nucleotidyltransferase domain-containing protein [Streptomyces janthinus]WND20661.1 nucleotidyltransferase domain-containing protein [Streptomyces janthinus]